MKTYDYSWLKSSIALDMRRIAQYGIYNGDPAATGSVVKRCTALHAPTGTVLIFTRDAGMHSCGWWKNPDYERCYHLSLSYRDPMTLLSRDRDKRLSNEWVELFFGENRRSLWVESPFSPEGKQREVWHYRLFMAEGWTAPIIPRKEVYSRDFIPSGWKSWSDAQAELAVPNFGEPLPTIGGGA